MIIFILDHNKHKRRTSESITEVKWEKM